MREDGDWAAVLPLKTKPKKKKVAQPAATPAAKPPPASATGATTGSRPEASTTPGLPSHPPAAPHDAGNPPTLLQRPYLRQMMTSRGCIDTTKLLNTQVSVPLGSVLGHLPPCWWERQAQESAAAGEK